MACFYFNRPVTIIVNNNSNNNSYDDCQLIPPQAQYQLQQAQLQLRHAAMQQNQALAQMQLAEWQRQQAQAQIRSADQYAPMGQQRAMLAEQQQKQRAAAAARDEEIWRRQQAQQQQHWTQQQVSLWNRQVGNQSVAREPWDGNSHGAGGYGPDGLYNKGYLGKYAPPQQLQYAGSHQNAHYQQNRVSSSPSGDDSSFSMKYLPRPHGYYHDGFIGPPSQYPASHHQVSSPCCVSSSPPQNSVLSYTKQQPVQQPGYYRFGQQLQQSHQISYTNVVAPAQYPIHPGRAPRQSTNQTFNQTHHGQGTNDTNGCYVEHRQAWVVDPAQDPCPPGPLRPAHQVHSCFVDVQPLSSRAADKQSGQQQQQQQQQSQAPLPPKPAPQSSPYVLKAKDENAQIPFMKPEVPSRQRLMRRPLQPVSMSDKNARVVEWLKTRPLRDIPLHRRKRSSSSPSPCERAKRVKEEVTRNLE